MSNEEPFLQRWARLKREGADKPAEPPAQAGEETVAKPAEPAAAPAEESLDLSKLPRLEDLTSHTDMRAFLDPRVPADLQTAALRRAWRLDPVIDTFIEVAENQYDWNTPGGAPGFGPLDAGPDLPRLLAQATGKLFEAPREAGSPVVVAAEDTSSTPADHAVPRAASAAVQEADTPAVPAVQVASLSSAESRDEVQPDHASDPVQRRRHGTALPR